MTAAPRPALLDPTTGAAVAVSRRTVELAVVRRGAADITQRSYAPAVRGRELRAGKSGGGMMRVAILGTALAGLCALPAAAATCAEWEAAFNTQNSAAIQRISREAFAVLLREDIKSVALGGASMVDGMTVNGKAAAAQFVAAECTASPRATVEQTAAAVYPMLRLFWLGAPSAPATQRR